MNQDEVEILEPVEVTADQDAEAIRKAIEATLDFIHAEHLEVLLQRDFPLHAIDCCLKCCMPESRGY